MMIRSFHSYLLPTGKKHKRGDASIRFIIFILVVVILLVAFLGQMLRDYRKDVASTTSDSSTADKEQVTTVNNNYYYAYPAAGGGSAGHYAQQQLVSTQSVPTGLPHQPLEVSISGRVLDAQSSLNQSQDLFDDARDSRFLIQGSVQVVEARSVFPVVICCLYGQGRTIRLAGVDEDIWRQGQERLNKFLSDSIEHARLYYNGKMLFEVVSTEYYDFGDVYGYLYIPHDDGLWWHPSYQENFYQVNLQLLRQGFARYQPNQDYLYKRLFIEAEDVAKSENQGMWY